MGGGRVFFEVLGFVNVSMLVPLLKKKLGSLIVKRACYASIKFILDVFEFIECYFV